MADVKIPDFWWYAWWAFGALCAIYVFVWVPIKRAVKYVRKEQETK